MTKIRHKGGRVIALKAHSLVGRSPLAHVRLTSSVVSLEHAVFHLIENQWLLRDLGSRNGTVLNGTRLSDHERYPLSPGDKICFGEAFEEWCLESAATDELCGTERESLHETTSLTLKSNLAETELCFSVSPNGEDLELMLRSHGQEVYLGNRAFHQLLLFLARARLQDRLCGLSPAEEGWRSRSELLDTFKITNERLNLDIYRARQLFGRYGIADSTSLFLLRKNSATLRIGAPHLIIS